MIVLTFLLMFFNVSSRLVESWTATSTHCIWNDVANETRLSRRIDLRDIRNQFLTVSTNDSTYYFNPCKSFNMPINDDPHSALGEQCHNVVACKKVHRVNESDQYFTIGVQLNSKVLQRRNNLIVRYQGLKSFANRSLLVRFECQRQVHRAQLKFIELEKNRTPVFTLIHRCCCPNVCGGNIFPRGLLLILLMVILFIIGTSIWIYCQCRRHYPERSTYGAIANGEINIKSLEPSSVLKLNPNESVTKRPRTRSIPSGGEGSTISSQDFKIVKRLGVGELGGEVCEGRWKEKLVAIKTLRIGIHSDKFSLDEKKYLEQQINKLINLRHKHLTSVIGICFDIDIYPRIILSFAEHGTIIDFIRRFPNKVDWPLRITWALHTAEALAFLHQSNVLHRNLKSSNILIGVDLRANISDYGLISILQPLRESCDSERCLCKLSHSALPVSIRWSAPEILSNSSDPEQFRWSCDVYSFGVCLWEQIRLEQPYFESKDEAQVARTIISGQRLNISDDSFLTILPEYQQLMMDCWKEIPSDRPNFEQISQTLRNLLSKVKMVPKSSLKRHASTSPSIPENPEEQSILSRLDSIISHETSKSFFPNC